MVTNILDSIDLEDLMDLVNTNGRMEILTLVFSKMDLNMAKASGRKEMPRQDKSQILMKEIITMIRKAGMVSLNGSVEINTEVNIKMMRGMGMVRCIG
jgi:hypothetical protein